MPISRNKGGYPKLYKLPLLGSKYLEINVWVLILCKLANRVQKHV